MNNNPLFFKRINLLGLGTFYYKEVKRFLSIPTQTILAPMVNSLLFLSIFHLSIGRLNSRVGELDFIIFLIPGLIMMSLIQNSFSSTSTAIVSGKMLGAINDMITPPLSNSEILIGFIGAGITRGVIISISNALAMYLFIDIYVYSWAYAIFFVIFGSMLMSTVGIVAGMWSEKWDHIAAISSYAIMPMSFLSGTFYSINQLPQQFQGIAQLNPFFYMVDGFRYAMTGQSDGNVLISMLIISTLSIIFIIITKILLDIGWKIKS
ncbi:MAG: ABC transporter permease [Alphaproteobacteria bacterium]|nr:ABC transporter permease [Alphaproteobacteria bacterium]